MTRIGRFADAAFSTWLYRLVVNACLDVARRRTADASVTARTPREPAASTDSQEDAYAHAELAASVRAAISRLPRKFRVAVLLRYFADLSYEEMAQALGCSMGTVASRLSRSHKMLAERLKQLSGPES